MQIIMICSFWKLSAVVFLKIFIAVVTHHVAMFMSEKL